MTTIIEFSESTDEILIETINIDDQQIFSSHCLGDFIKWATQLTAPCLQLHNDNLLLNIKPLLCITLTAAKRSV